MRIPQVLGCVVFFVAAAAPALAQESFDACEVLTQADAEKALGTTVTGESVNPKAKRPRVVLNCTYTGVNKEGNPVAAQVLFKFARTEGDAQKAFDDARLHFQTKPMYIGGAEAFWSAKTGQMNLRKGRTWLILSVGSVKTAERDVDQTKRLAELLGRKL